MWIYERPLAWKLRTTSAKFTCYVLLPLVRNLQGTTALIGVKKNFFFFFLKPPP